jgi:hypothetical protein
MKQRTKLILILGIALIALMVVVYLVISALRGPSPSSDGDARGGLFPFGQNRQERNQNEGDEESIVIREETEQIIETRRDDRPRVFRVTNRPVTTFNLYGKEREVIVTKQNDAGESFNETIIVTDTLAIFSDTRDGVIVSTNLDDEELTETVLTEGTVERAREGIIGGEQGEYITLRFVNEVSDRIDTFLGERKLEELPERICRVAFTSDVGRGDRGQEVLQLQQILNFKQSGALVGDGVFGTKTESSLVAFQEEKGLEITKRTDAVTREALSTECLDVERTIQQSRDKPQPVRGVFLRENIHSFVLAPNNLSAFYLVKDTSGSKGYLLDLETQKESLIFTSPFSEWIATWGSNTSVLLHTAASGLVEGVAYELNTTTREFKRVVGNIEGLTTLQSPDGSYVLVSEGTRTTLKLSVYNTRDNTTSSTALKTLPEKCTWSKDSTTIYCAVPDFTPKNIYPEAWYKGIVSFRDAIWKIDAASGLGEKIVNPNEFNTEVDALDLQLSEQENYLLLRNKLTNTLWGIDLNY